MILAGKKEYNLNINAYEIKKLFHWTVIAPILAWVIYFLTPIQTIQLF